MKAKKPVITESKPSESKIENTAEVNKPLVKEVKSTSVNNIQKAISKNKNDLQVNKSPVKEVTKTPISDNLKKETVQKTPKDAKPVLVVKSGNTDLRRGEKELKKIVENIGMDPHDGTMYAFSNMKNSVKIVQEKDNATVLVVNKTKKPIEAWPGYKPQGEAGHTVKFSGKNLKQFIEKIGISTN